MDFLKNPLDPHSFADRDDIFCQFVGFGIGHKIQYSEKLASKLDGASKGDEDLKPEDIEENNTQPSWSDIDYESDLDPELADKLLESSTYTRWLKG